MPKIEKFASIEDVLCTNKVFLPTFREVAGRIPPDSQILKTAVLIMKRLKKWGKSGLTED